MLSVEGLHTLLENNSVNQTKKIQSTIPTISLLTFGFKSSTKIKNEPATPEHKMGSTCYDKTTFFFQYALHELLVLHAEETRFTSVNGKCCQATMCTTLVAPSSSSFSSTPPFLNFNLKTDLPFGNSEPGLIFFVISGHTVGCL